MSQAEHVDTIIIGGGQAGLSVGYHLARRKLPFLILEAHERVGDSWRLRWDSLRLFTPARFNGLDGMPFPAAPYYLPTKDEMADYLESYADRFALPVRTSTRVVRLSHDRDRFVIEADAQHFEANNVVVAMADFQVARVPDFADQLDPDIVQIHSADYRRPEQLQPGAVLIVGAGNSGAEIAVEVGRTHEVLMAGRDVGEVPIDLVGRAGRLGLTPLVLRFVFHRVLTMRTPMGRRLRPKVLHIGGPLIRVKSPHLAAAGVKRVPRVGGVEGGKPKLDDGRVLDVANVIWCTGFDPGFSWIDLPVTDGGDVAHEAGIVERVPGLYFVGLHFLYALSSVMIHGVGRDADRIAGKIETRRQAPAPAGTAA